MKYESKYKKKRKKVKNISTYYDDFNKHTTRILRRMSKKVKKYDYYSAVAIGDGSIKTYRLELKLTQGYLSWLSRDAHLRFYCDYVEELNKDKYDEFILKLKSFMIIISYSNPTDSPEIKPVGIFACKKNNGNNLNSKMKFINAVTLIAYNADDFKYEGIERLKNKGIYVDVSIGDPIFSPFI